MEFTRITSVELSRIQQTEIELAQNLIETYLSKSLNSTQKFISFCERVELAYQYLHRNPARFIPHPLKWLSQHFEHGYYFKQKKLGKRPNFLVT